MRWLIVLALVASLGSCGFAPAKTWSQLDGPVQLVSVEPFNPVQRELQALINQSLAQAESSTTPAGLRRIELDLIDMETDVISVDNNGRPAEYRLRLTQRATLSIDEQNYAESFTQTLDYVFDVRDILAYQRQVDQQKQVLYQRLAQQILYVFAARLHQGER